MSRVRPFAAFALFCLTADLYPPPASAQEPTADAVKALREAFTKERAASAKDNPPADALAAADKAAAKADAALAAGDPKAAARLVRDARWLLPARPAGMPPHVRLVIGTVRLRHADRVNGLSYSPDGTKLASASRDGSVRVWDLGNGRELLAYRGHPAPPTNPDDKGGANTYVPLRVPDVKWSPSGDLVASCGMNEIHLWEPATGKLVKTLKKHTALVKALAFSADGKRLASGGDDKLAVVWDVAAGKDVYASAPHDDRIESVAFGPDGKSVAAADAKGFVTVHNPASTDKKPLAKLAATDGGAQATSVAYTPDGAKLLAGGYDKLARFLTAARADGGTPAAPAGALLKFTGHTDSVTAAGVTTDGKLVVTASADRTVRVWDAVGGKQVRLFQGHLDRVTALAIRPDGRQAATGGEDGAVKLWDLSAVDDHRQAAGATDSIWAAAYSPDGTRFAAAGADRNIRVYDANGKLLHTLTGHDKAVTSLAFLAPDRLASAGGDKVIKLWDVAAGKPVKDLSGHTSAVLALAAEGGRLISASADKTVRAWDPAAGKAVWTWEGKSAAAAVAARRDGKRVAVGSADGTLTLLDTGGATPQPAGAVLAHLAGVAAAAFSPDGAKLATAGGDGAVKVWAVADDAPPTSTARFETAAKAGTTGAVLALSAVAFSPDGRQVAAAGADGVVRVWDLATGAEARALRGPTDWVTAVTFSPDGERLLAAGVDKVGRVFDLGRSDLSGPAGHAKPARCAAVSKDGKWVATGGEDKTVKLWDAATGKELAALTGLKDTPFALAFVAPDRLAAVTDERDQRLHLWSVPDGKEIKAVPVGRGFSVSPLPGGGILTWARNPQQHDEFARFAADGTPAEGGPLVEKGRDSSCASFAADGSVVAVGAADGTVRVIDLKTKGRVGADWPIFTKRVADMGLTPDAATLVAVDDDGVVKVGDVAKREVKHTAKVLAADVGGLVVSPAGGRFAVFGTDGTLKAFDFTAKELRSWSLPVPANGAAFTPDGKAIVTANADGTVYVLDLPPAGPE